MNDYQAGPIRSRFQNRAVNEDAASSAVVSNAHLEVSFTGRVRNAIAVSEVLTRKYIISAIKKRVSVRIVVPTASDPLIVTFGLANKNFTLLWHVAAYRACNLSTLSSQIT